MQKQRKQKGVEWKISGIEDNITKAKAISFIGIAIGILGIVLAFLHIEKA